jgi:hypothetical protein
VSAYRTMHRGQQKGGLLGRKARPIDPRLLPYRVFFCGLPLAALPFTKPKCTVS